MGTEHKKIPKHEDTLKLWIPSNEYLVPQPENDQIIFKVRASHAR
jgi:hypothetical protein